VAVSAVFLRWPWSRGIEPPDPGTYAGQGILLASEGRKIPRPAVELAARMARQAGAPVHVLAIARVWGSAFGLPHPGLRPNAREWQAQQAVVGEAIGILKRRGVEASGQVLGTRNPARQIVAVARRRGCDAIVMGTEPARHWLIADFLWSQEPHRVRRRACMPVHLVIDPPARQRW
jgi:nucleotide-binding universal stress UspA family protein